MTLAMKLKLRPGARGAVLGAPRGYRKALGTLPAVRALRPEGLLWISFPKGTSAMQTDLTRDAGWEALRKYPLKWVVLVAVDDTWSAFCVRPYRTGEARRSFR